MVGWCGNAPRQQCDSLDMCVKLSSPQTLNSRRTIATLCRSSCCGSRQHSFVGMMHESSDAKPKSAGGGANKGFFRSIKSFDIYPKIDESYRVQTSGGALLSILGWVLIGILVLAEAKNYMTPKFKEHMIVDTSLGQQLRVNINITFHSLTCNEVHLDAMDVAGDNQLNVEHEMIKQRVSKNGIPIGVAGVEIIGEGPLEVEDLPANYCGDCYGADSPDVRCCNTCNDLIQAYQRKQWSVTDILRNATQCIHDRAKHFANLGADEGCTVSGKMLVNKVAGNFHIAHGESIVRDGRHIHQFNPALAPKFNVSHTIHSISFGDPYPSMPANPLDKVKRIIAEDESTGLFQYFIRVIPTIYTNEFGHQVHTNQYTITDRFRPLAMPQMAANDKPQEAVLPGIFFVYELSPFMIEASRIRMPILHFVTKLCAIVGGVFTVLGVLDSILFRLQKLTGAKSQ